MTARSHEIILPVEGVDDEHSALMLTNRLGRIRGIDTCRVEVNNKRVVITSQDTRVISEAVKGIRELGYGVPTVKKSFTVLEMSCAACAVSVGSMLQSQPGVINAGINYATAAATVEFIPEMVRSEELKKAVQSIGYDLLIEDHPAFGETAESIRQVNFRRLKRRTFLALALSLPLLVIGMFFMEMPYAIWVMWALSTPVLVWLGRDFYINAWKQSRHRSAGMDTLVALSTGVAYVFSVFNTLFPAFWHQRGLHAHVYFEAAAVIIAFLLLGKFLEEKAKAGTTSAIKKLMGLQPAFVTVENPDGSYDETAIEKVEPGHIILVKPGGKIAVDGIVTEGNSWVDESMLSGEPVPVPKKESDPVFAGTINQNGRFRFRAEKVGSETMLARIIKMVQDAQGSKAPVQKLVDKLAGIFVPMVILVALVAFILWNLLGGDEAFTHGLQAMITVLVIACPCALGLATPTAIMVGVGKAAEKGILIKDAESLELARKVNAVVLDKTGTLTLGKPEITDEFWADEDPWLKHILFTIEKMSEHPLAEAVVKHLNFPGTLSVDEFETIPGKGVRAVVDGEIWYVGNKTLLGEHRIFSDGEVSGKASHWGHEAKTVIWFARQEKTIAVLAVADPIKESSKDAVAALQNGGIEVYMVTGDNETTASAIATQAGIRFFRAGVLPEQKASFVKELQDQGKIVAMVGDGINDSTALARADVSMAMGKGSDIAMDVAAMTIISSDPGKIAEAISLSKATVRTIRENLFWAFVYNLVAIPVAAGILFPINGFLLNPMVAGAAMALSSVSVVSNSLRLKWKK